MEVTVEVKADRYCVVTVGSHDLWLSRDEAIAVLDALPGVINQLPVAQCSTKTG